ncbi:hypothetical protein FCH28_05870 [Streptomyces piniterrae]|uniref:OmpR/PhoB-type domain-containing protein n=1 Tax=Streptomyces piniterrae TaxID=2571125 RepID=A0A4U0NSI7_9ACTN|nr:BTAD domain-containing putative transcriptional regulator [Streptomyces piniterrae]TJZ57002.1 hypothetical protein FCH28_05870 [Streptomyces piniterrae]
MRKRDAPLPRSRLVHDAGGHCTTGTQPTDLSGADVGLQLLRVALRLIQDADGGDEGTRTLKQVAGRLDSTGMPRSSQAVRSAWRIAAQRPDAVSATAGCGCRDDHTGPAPAGSGASPTDPSCEGCGQHLTAAAGCRRATDAHLIRSWARELLALLDADEEPRCTPAPGSAGASPAAVQSGPDGPSGRWHPPAVSAYPGERNPRVAIRCFGGFRMTVGDLVIDWTKVRPRARAAMRLLTMRAGRPMHREALIEALWPDVHPKSATANLQVAVSSLRGVLEPDRDRGKPRLVVRVGDAYLLNLPSDAYLDTLAFQTALTRGRQAKASGDTAAAVQGLRDALAQYHGELLPEDGPAEWLQQDREIYRRQAADAAAELAAVELQAGNLQEAVAAAEKCLAIDRFHDTGWHLLLRTYHRIGAPAAAEQARRRYAATLASLGLDTDEPAVGVTATSSPTSRRGTPMQRQYAGRPHRVS